MEDPRSISKPTSKTFNDYLIFWGGQTLSLLGSSVVSFAISWWATIEYANETYLTMLVFAGIAPVILLSPVAGVFADRFNKKLIIGISDSLQAILTIVMIFFFVNGSISYPVLFGIQIGRGFCQGFHSPTVQSIIPIMVPQEKLSRINGVNFLFNGMINIISPIISAILLGFMSIGSILWIDFGSFLVAVAVLFAIKIPKVKTEKTSKTRKASYFADFVEGIKTMRLIKGILTLTIVSLFLNLITTPFNSLESFYIAFIHEGTKDHRAILSITVGLGYIVGALITSIKKEWKNKIAWTIAGLLSLCFGLGIISLAPYQWFWLIYLGGFVLTVMNPIINTIAITAIQKIVPPDKIGRVMSVLMGAVMAVTPIGYLISGPIAQLIGVRLLFLISAIIGLLVVIIGLTFGNFGLLKDGDEKFENGINFNQNND